MSKLERNVVASILGESHGLYGPDAKEAAGKIVKNVEHNCYHELAYLAQYFTPEVVRALNGTDFRRMMSVAIKAKFSKERIVDMAKTYNENGYMWRFMVEPIFNNAQYVILKRYSKYFTVLDRRRDALALYSCLAKCPARYLKYFIKFMYKAKEVFDFNDFYWLFDDKLDWSHDVIEYALANYDLSNRWYDLINPGMSLPAVRFAHLYGEGPDPNGNYLVEADYITPAIDGIIEYKQRLYKGGWVKGYSSVAALLHEYNAPNLESLESCVYSAHNAKHNTNQTAPVHLQEKHVPYKTLKYVIEHGEVLGINTMLDAYKAIRHLY